jgi:hypothetical protein
MGKCSKCGCSGFKWNPVSAAQKAASGISGSIKGGIKGVGVGVDFQTMPYQDNKSDQVAYNNCTCGHHKNYHS